MEIPEEIQMLIESNRIYNDAYREHDVIKVSDVEIIIKEAVRMAAQSNCECPPEETTGNILEPVCNTCGRVQENENIK